MILNTSSTGEDALVLEKVMEILDEEQIIVFDSMDSFFSRLLSPTQDRSIVIFIVASEAELEILCQRNDLFFDFVVIVFVRNCTAKMLNQCYSLRPRLICKTESDLALIPMVLGKLQNNQDQIKKKNGNGIGV